MLSGYPKCVETFARYIAQDAEILMPSIILHEVLSNSKYETEEPTRKAVDNYILLSIDHIIGLTNDIARKSAELRRHYRIKHNNKLKAPDAIIASTAMLYEATLVSNNFGDFKHAISLGLKFENPIEDQEDLQNHRNSKV